MIASYWICSRYLGKLKILFADGNDDSYDYIVDSSLLVIS